MAVYVSLKCGISLDDEQLLKVVSNIAGYLDKDIPDRTWDLAWLTMAFVNLPKDNRVFTVMSDDGSEESVNWKLQDLTKKLVNKLLTGQIQEGKLTKGLWGPVCIDAFLLTKMLPYTQQMIKKTITRIKNKLKAKPDNARLSAKLDKAKEAIDDFQQQFLWISQTIQQNYIQNIRIKYGEEEGRKRGIEVRGFPYFYVGEQLADMETTALVLYALREAHLKGYLPAKTIVPKDLKGKDFVKPRKTLTILKQTADTLLKLQKGKNAGSEANFWFPEHRFDSIGFPHLPFDDKKFESLESPINEYSRAYAYMAFRCLYDLLGTKNIGTRFYKSLRVAAKELACGVDAVVNKKIKMDRYDGYLNTFNLIFANFAYSQDHQFQGMRMTEYLLENQKYKNASWLKPGNFLMVSSSLKSYFKINAKHRFDLNQSRLPKDKRKKFNEKAEKNQVWWQRSYYGRSHAADITSTCISMLQLIDSLRVPAVGIWNWRSRVEKSTSLNGALKALRAESGVVFKTINLPEKLSENQLNGLPLMFLSGTKNFAPEKLSIDILKNYLERGGLLIVEAPGSPDGFQFIKDARKMLIELLHKGKLHTFSKGTKTPALNSLLNSGGYIAVVFIPLQSRKAAKKRKSKLFSKKQYIKEMTNILRKRLGPEYLSNTYAVNWESFRKEEAAAIIAEVEAKTAVEKAAEKKAEEEAAKLEGKLTGKR